MGVHRGARAQQGQTSAEYVGILAFVVAVVLTFEEFQENLNAVMVNDLERD
jgi:hypothetical protein